MLQSSVAEYSMWCPGPRVEGDRIPTRNSCMQRRARTPTHAGRNIFRCYARSLHGISFLDSVGRAARADVQAKPSLALAPNPSHNGGLPPISPVMPALSSDGTTPIITSRRCVTLLLASNISAFGLLDGGCLPFCRPARAAPSPSRQAVLPACSGPVDGRMAVALTRAVYSAVQAMQVMDEQDFQRETFKLREREYRYYATANASQLPLIPDLSDNTGGLSNPTYLNFICYCLWKVVYRHLTDSDSRQIFARRVAADLLSRLGAEDGNSGGGGISSLLAMPVPLTDTSRLPPDAAVRSAVLPLLDLLRARGYLCTYQLVLGAHPGSWPQDWMSSQAQVLDVTQQGADDGDMDLQEAESTASMGSGVEAAGAAGNADSGVPEAVSVGLAGGPASSPVEGLCEGSGGSGPVREFLFQVKLHRPADLLASVALRSEEDGAWPRTVSNCLVQMLARQGYGDGGGAGCQEELLSDTPRGAAGAGGQGGSACGGSTWCVEVDEFFYQDVWQGPRSWTDRLLLLLGDPLEQVGVDFAPTTLVQNWRLRLGGMASRAGGGGSA